MAIRTGSLRGVVLSYIVSEPGNETINTITEDLNKGRSVASSTVPSLMR